MNTTATAAVVTPFIDTVSDLLAHNRIPTLDAGQMSDFSRYLFTASNKTERIQVAEVVYRHDHDHPSALDVFLACTLPLAERSARRRAHKIFIYPTDWQVELMYDGAVTAAIAVFQCNSVIESGSDAFRRYLYRALALGTVRSYFRREEYDGVFTVADFGTVPTRKRPFRNQSEQEIITRDLLNQVTGFPNLRPHVCATLQCIQALGTDEALKEVPGVEVIGEASDGHEAIRLVTTARPDVVFMDISVPLLNGLEATERIIKALPEVRVVILSRHENEEYYWRALKVGASGYLLKKAVITELKAAVQRVAAGEIYLSPEIATRLRKNLPLHQIARGRSPVEQLSERQRDILQLIAESFTTKAIACTAFFTASKKRSVASPSESARFVRPAPSRCLTNC